MSAPNPQGRFGTFGGVFTPCTLTILGVIMFMRSGYVVGQAGIWQALFILALAKSITTLTTLSLSAIATNTEVRTGGVYYMISRTLGPDFGGSIGLTLYVSQAVSIAFYVIGFTEALFGLFAPPGSELATTLATWHATQLCSVVVICGLFFVTFKGADVALRAQYFILAILLLSVVSFLIGGFMTFDPDVFASNQGEFDPAATPVAGELSIGMWGAFAIFFPAATGITAGANMSGDLRDPGSAIPKGTLAAIIFTAAVYLIQLILLAGGASRESLVGASFESLTAMSIFAPLIVAGVFAATLSSALGSFLGAPRILQAMGMDRVLRPLEYFAKGHGPENEPRRATVLSLGIALAIVFMGDLNAVAEVISMFFLIAYGMINLSAFVEGRGGNPSFRPRFRLFGWPAALAGAIGCAIAMVKIDETYAIVAMIIAGGIYFYLRGKEAEWGDAKRGFIFSRTRENLLALERSKPDPKNWRPVLVVLTDDVTRDRALVKAGSWLEAGRGLLSVLEISEGAGAEPEGRLEKRLDRMGEVKRLLGEYKLVGFADSVVVPPDDEQLDIILQAYSIGSLRPNTALIRMPPASEPEARERTARRMQTLAAWGSNVVVYKPSADGASPGRRRIDVWWGGQKNGSLLALLAYLVNLTPDWSKARIRMLQIVKSGGEHLEAERAMAELVQAARLNVDIEVILSQEPVPKIISETSASSDLVLLGMADQAVADFGTFMQERTDFLDRMPTTLLVASNGETDVLA